MVAPGVSPRPKRATFAARLRLRHDLEFERVFAAKMKKPRGPLIGFAAPNGLGHWRLGLSIGRAVGSAVERNAVKRRVREAFRQTHTDFPLGARGGFDLVVAARAHDTLAAPEYRALLTEIARALHAAWARRDGGGDAD